MEGPTAAPFDFFSPLSSPGFSLQFCLLLFSFFPSSFTGLVFSYISLFFPSSFTVFGLQFLLLLLFFLLLSLVRSSVLPSSFFLLLSLGSITTKNRVYRGSISGFKNTTINPKNATIGYSDVSYSRIYKPGLYYAAIAPYKSIATFLQPWLKVKPIAAVKHCLTAAIGFGPIAAFLKNAATGPL